MHTRDAHNDDQYAVNDMACDMLFYGNRETPDWAERVILARQGSATYENHCVVTGPAILFRYDSPRQCHVRVDDNLLVLPSTKMGNALIWPVFNKFSPDASPVSDAPVSDAPPPVSGAPVSDALVSDVLVSDALGLPDAGPVSTAISDINMVSDADQCLPPLAAAASVTDIPEERDQEQSVSVLNEPDEDPSPSLAVSTEKAAVMIDATAEPSPKKPKRQAPKEKDALSPVVHQTRSRTGRQLKPNSRYAQ
jgi:hypothetical protein